MSKLYKKGKLSIGDYGSLLALIILVLFMSLAKSEFATISNIISLIRQASINGLIAFGMTVVILTGGIDLSVGSTLGLVAMLGAGAIKAGVSDFVAIPLMVFLGAALGSVSGILISKGRLQPFIATLVTMTIYRGLIMIYCGGKPVSRIGSEESLRILALAGKGYFLGIPVPVWILLSAFCIFVFMLEKTPLGRYFYAVGSNYRAAGLAGVNIGRTKMIAYCASGIMSAIAGVILLSRLGGSAQPTMGQGFELDAIAAVALGGTSMSGGKGRISGTLIGVLIIAVLSNGLNVMGVSSYYQDVVKGLVILISVLTDRDKD